MERLVRAVHSATASEQFPGAVLFAETVSGERFPDTLVVWKPAAGVEASNPTGLPRFSELVVFCPDPARPGDLLEITSRGDLRTAPALTSTGQWASELAMMKTGNVSSKTVLTDMLRTASPGGGASRRGCARFEVALRPTAAEIASYRNGTLAWYEIAWPQHWYGEKTGLRQTWVRFELQLLPNSRSSGAAAEVMVIPFFGSAALYSEITR
jgi:hypothetical protein